MKKIYRSPYEAYPFLSDEAQKYDCDFEILTDEIASLTGLLAEEVLIKYKKELIQIEEIIYHLNPSLRTFCSVTEEEIMLLAEKKKSYAGEFQEVRFVLPAGCKSACLSHVIRVKCKELVRLAYRAQYAAEEKVIPKEVFDTANLLSDYFFYLALKCNQDESVDEIPFVSRNYF